MILLPGDTIGPYRVIERIGTGGMATVYKANHTALDRLVALKVLHPALVGDQTFLARFQREGRIVAKLDHPNIIPIYDFAEHDGTPYLVMHYVDGPTLKAILSEGPLSTNRVISIIAPVAQALTYAHSQSVLHRDIKPSNIMCAKDGHIFLTDFGLASIAESRDTALSQEMVVGTPQYVSPELARGERATERSDIYSLGVVLYEMLTGRVPFNGDTPYAVLHDHIYTELPLPTSINPAISKDVERVLLQALAKDPNARYGSVADLFAALEKAATVEKAAPSKIAAPSDKTAPSEKAAPPQPAAPVSPPVAAVSGPAVAPKTPPAAKTQPMVPVKAQGRLVSKKPPAPPVSKPTLIPKKSARAVPAPAVPAPTQKAPVAAKKAPKRGLRFWVTIIAVVLLFPILCALVTVSVGGVTPLLRLLQPAAMQAEEIRTARNRVLQNPRDPNAYIVLGDTYAAYHQNVLAFDAYDTAIKLAPKAPHPYVQAGELATSLSEYERAAKYYVAARTAAPVDVELLLGEGDLFYQWKKYDQAVLDYEVALQLQPKNARAAWGLASVHGAQGKGMEAVGDYIRAVGAFVWGLV